MGSSVSYSSSSSASDSTSGDKLSKTNKDFPLRQQYDGEDGGNYTLNKESLYRWTMWRLRMNEEMCRQITASQDDDMTTMFKSRSTSEITAPFLEHPTSLGYGRTLKERFGVVDNEPEDETLRVNSTMPDHLYLVYGLPRISVSRTVPDHLRDLYSSNLSEYSSEDGVQTAVTSVSDTVPETVESDTTANKLETGNAPRKTQFAPPPITFTLRSHRKKSASSDVEEEPLAGKSRQFWKSLSDRKTEIIRFGKQQQEANQEGRENNEGYAHLTPLDSTPTKNLHPSISKESRSRQRWRSLASSKAEVLKLEKPYQSWDTEEEIFPRDDDTHAKRKHRTNFLWKFLLSSKKDLQHMKKSDKRRDSASHHGNQASSIEPGHRQTAMAEPPTKAVSSGGNFQMELAERLRRRREAVYVNSDCESFASSES